MADIVLSVASKVAEYLVAPVGRQCGYVIFSDSYVRQLNDEVKKLEDARVGVQRSINDAHNNMKDIKREVDRWKNDAETVANKARDVLENDGSAQKTCFYGWLPNPKARYRLGRVAKRTVQAIQELIQQGQFETVFYESAPPGHVAGTLDLNSSAGDGGDTITDSRASIFQGIMKALDDEKHKVIGVYGPGGVGKSTLLEEVEKKLRKEGRPFHMIVKAKVSQTPDLKKIQDDIAYAFRLNLKDEPSEAGRRDLLFKRLQKDPSEKVLVILDDLWKELDLREVGIPSGDESRGCQVLLTSRYKDVLQQKMRAFPIFHLQGLKDDEAFKLFEKTVGDRLKDDEELKAIAPQVVEKLAGLPLLIISVASTLKDSDVCAWRNALIKIDESNMETIVKLSYDHLRSEDARSLFLLCGLIGGTIQVETLLILGMGLGLFEEFRRTIQDSRDRLNATLDELRSACLLLDRGDAKDNVTIHDLYSEVVVSTPFKGQNSLIMNSNYGSWPKEKLEKCWAICLGSDRLAELMPCQFLNLKILMCSHAFGMGDDSILNFTYMKELRVLYLRSMYFTALPSSIEILGNLQSLYLNSCSVEDVAILGKLKALQILSFASSAISRLPKEIGELTNLRSLNLSYCYQLRKLEPGVLKDLINLEELHMKECFARWMDEDEIPSESCNARLAELKSLTKLTSLEISICDPTILFKDGDLPFRNLIKFWINIGNAEGRNFEGLRTMKLKFEGRDSIFSIEWVQKTLQKTQYLHLDGLREFKKNAHELCIRFPQVKHLDIQNSPSIKYIASSSNGAFTILESLFLNNLINLEKICHGLVAAECFKKLKAVRVTKCDRLKYLWYLSQMQRLVQLEEIEVQECDSMRAIVTDDAGKDIVAAYNKVELPNVHRLGLAKLPNMTNFCAGTGITSEGAPIQAVVVDEEGRDEGTDDIMEFRLLKRLFIHDCPMEKFFSYSHGKKESLTATSDSQGAYSDPFFDRKVDLPSLEELTLDLVGSIQRIWHGELPRRSYCELATLTLENCPELLNIFPSTIIGRLHNLKSVSIEECPSLESLFDCGSHDSNMEHKIVLLPKLESVHVSGAGRLRHVVKSDSKTVMGFPSLKYVYVENCSNLRHLFPYFTATTLEKLETLRIINCEKMKEVTHMREVGRSEAEVMSFPCLRSMTLDKLDNLICFSSGSCSYGFASLEDLNILQCRNLGVFIPSPISVKRPLGEMAEEDDKSSQPLFNEMVTFPNLKSLKIKGVPCKQLWSNQISNDSFSKLEHLKLKHCDNLLRIAPSHMWKWLHNCLETLRVISCRSIVITFESDGKIEKSGKLRSLVLRNLDNLMHIWPYNALPNGEIRDIEVVDCRNMKAMIVDEEGRDEEMDDIIEFPLLKRLAIIGCPTEKFFSYPQGMKESVTTTSNSQNAYSDSFFDRKVSLPSLENLVLDSVGSFKRIWHGELPRSSFCKLATLTLESCSDLLNIFPSTIIGRLQNLKSVKVSECPSLESLFDCGSLDSNMENKIVFLPKLEQVRVSGARRLSHVVMSDSQTVLGFPSLENVTVQNCSELRYLFPNYTATTLGKLNNLSIGNCKQMKEVVPKEEAGRPNADVMTFPSLTYLRVLQCPNFEAFIRSTTSVQRQLGKMAKEDDELPQPYFNEMATFPNLKSLTIKGAQCKELWNNQIPDDSFCKLEHLELKRCDNLLCVAPSHMWKWLQHCLETLKVISCRSIGINFESDGKVKKSGKLRSLVLHDLDNLRHIWQYNGLPNGGEIRDIEVVDCRNMKAVIVDEEERDEEMDDIVEFPLLKRLVIKGCPIEKFFSYPHGKKELVTTTSNSQNAYSGSFFDRKVSLPSLEDLVLHSVGSFKTIWHDELPRSSFCQLASLTLESCSNLLDVFPSTIIGRLKNLKSVHVFYCPSLESLFDCGSLDSNKEHKIVLLPKLEQVRVSGAKRLRHVMMSNSPIVLGFPNLKDVIVGNCSELRYLFPNYTATTLGKLESLWIGNCKQMKEVVPKEEAGRPNAEVMSFPRLSELALSGLENLICFSSRSCSYDFASLRHLSIWHCHNFGAFIPSPTSVERPLGKTTEEDDELPQPLFNEMVTFPNLRSLKIEGARCKELWNKQIPNDSFCKLEHLELEDCDNLLSIAPSHIWKRLQRCLETLKVISCRSIEIKFESDGMVERSDKLRSLVLRDLDNLRHIWQYNGLPTGREIRDIEVVDCRNMKAVIVDEEGRNEGIDDIIEFSLLKRLSIRGCPTKKFFSYPRGKIESITTTSDSQDTYSNSFFDQKVSLPSLEQLWLDSVGSFKRIWHKGLPRSSFCKLATVILCSCSDLLDVFPSTIIERLHNLKTVLVSKCASLELLFDCGSLDSNIEHKIVLLPKLEQVSVSGAGRLRHVVMRDSQTILGFPSLKDVWVDNCSDLRYLFPYLTARTLEKLERLQISNCKQMMEVVPKETVKGDYESQQSLFNEMVTFPNIRHLKIKGARCKELWNKQILNNSFYKLESLELMHCDNLQRVAPSYMWKRLQHCLEILKVRSCRSIEIIYENDGTVAKSGKLRTLVLHDLDNLRHIWQYDGLPNIPFPNLRSIEAKSCPRLEILFPTFTAKFLAQIEELGVRSCEDMELIAGHEECEEATATTITFSKLTTLGLFSLPKFRSFLPEKYRLEFPSREVFRRVSCGTEPDEGSGDEEESEGESEGED